MSLTIVVADDSHTHYAAEICQLMEASAKVRGTGIAKRNPSYIIQKIQEGKAVIAMDGSTFVGFCYIESWDGHKYVANSGLIVHPAHRGTGVARAIKEGIFALSKKLFPEAIIFGITTSLPVMKINSDLGYKPVTFSELTQDDVFWKGCQTCTNFDILQRTNRKMCLCTAMVCQPDKKTQDSESKRTAWAKFKAFVASRKKIKKSTLTQIESNHEK